MRRKTGRRSRLRIKLEERKQKAKEEGKEVQKVQEASLKRGGVGEIVVETDGKRKKV